MDRLGAWASNIVKLPTIRELRAQIKVYLPQDQSTHSAPPPSDWSQQAPLIPGLLL